MARIVRCDGCGKEEPTRTRFAPGTEWIGVEADEDADSYDACSWACVAQVALMKAAEVTL